MTERKTTRIDLHVHTRGSDGWGSPEAIAENAVEAGLDGLVITDHHLTYTREGLEVAEACREAGLWVFHGCEYSAAEGHLLVYGVPVESLRLGRYADMQKVIDLVTEFGGVAVPAHPYFGYRAKLGDQVHRLRRVRALEVANGQRAVKEPGANRRALRAANLGSRKGTGGSDAHDPAYVGVCYTEFQGNIRSSWDLVKALKRGDYRAVTQHARVRKILESTLAFWKRQADPFVSMMPPAKMVKVREEADRCWTEREMQNELDLIVERNRAARALDTSLLPGHFGEDDEHGSGNGRLH